MNTCIHTVWNLDQMIDGDVVFPSWQRRGRQRKRRPSGTTAGDWTRRGPRPEGDTRCPGRDPETGAPTLCTPRPPPWVRREATEVPDPTKTLNSPFSPRWPLVFLNVGLVDEGWVHLPRYLCTVCFHWTIFSSCFRFLAVVSCLFFTISLSFETTQKENWHNIWRMQFSKKFGTTNSSFSWLFESLY